MQIYNTIVSSKNKKSLKIFLKLFRKHLARNFYCVKKNFFKKKGVGVVALLTSPHANKNAQEQFEIRNWEVQLTSYTTQPFKFLIFLKKLRTTLFPDLNFKLKNSCSVNRQDYKKNFFFNLNKYKLTKSSMPKKNKKKIKKTKDSRVIKKRNNITLKFLELYGKMA